MKRMIYKEQLPWVLSAGRAALGPVMVWGTRAGWSPASLAGLIVVALLSDIYDGVLARRWHCDTAGVRLFDSVADTFFYFCVGVAVWMSKPDVWAQHRVGLLAVVAAEAVNIGFALRKFGRMASYHSYLAKSWGLVLAAAVVWVFAVQGSAGAAVTVACAMGVLCNVEGLAMSLMLPVWRRDVKGLWVAWGLRGEGSSTALRAGVGVTAALVVMLATVPCSGQAPGAATYTGGTIPRLTSGAEGVLDWTPPLAFTFRSAGSVLVTIPYAQITKVELRAPVMHHLGFLPAVAVGLVRTRKRRHILTVRYAEESGVVQAVTFEIPKDDVGSVHAALWARAAACDAIPTACDASSE